MSRRVQIHLDLSVSQARTLRRALTTAAIAYEGSEDSDATTFAQLAKEIGPIVSTAIEAAGPLCPNCQSERHARCCARCGRRVREPAHEFCSRRCEQAQAIEDLASAQEAREEGYAP